MSASAGTVAYIGGYKDGWSYLVINPRGYHGKRGRIDDVGEVDVGNENSYTSHLHAVFHLLQDYPGKITIRTSSKYTISCFTEWIEKWIETGFRGSDGCKIANANLLQAIYHMVADKRAKFEYTPVIKTDKYKMTVDQEAYNGYVAIAGEFRGRIN